jgi:hypothetical protein
MHREHILFQLPILAVLLANRELRPAEIPDLSVRILEDDTVQVDDDSPNKVNAKDVPECPENVANLNRPKDDSGCMLRGKDPLQPLYEW